MARKAAQRAERALQEGIAGAACRCRLLPLAVAGEWLWQFCLYCRAAADDDAAALTAAAAAKLLQLPAHQCAPPSALPLTGPGLAPFPPPAAGMIKAKGLGKKKRREKEKARKSGDRGLMEDGGAFRPGIMRVRPAGGSGGGSGARRR